MRLHSYVRGNRGAAELVEGVVGLWLIIGFMIAASVLLINVLAASFNKEKLGFVTDMAAVYGSNLPADTTNAPQLIDDRVKVLLKEMSLKTTTLNVTSKWNDHSATGKIGTRPSCAVTIDATVPTLLSASMPAFMPVNIKMTDTSVALMRPWNWSYGSCSIAAAVLPGWITPGLNVTGYIPKDGKTVCKVILPELVLAGTH
ncbi:hypothetical protein BH10CYA1_BH10CYA1_34660 [soil metagenome]